MRDLVTNIILRMRRSLAFFLGVPSIRFFYYKNVFNLLLTGYEQKRSLLLKLSLAVWSQNFSIKKGNKSHERILYEQKTCKEKLRQN